MEGGPLRVLFRGNGVSMVAGVPSAAVGWQVFESVRLLLEDFTGGPSLSTSFLGGCVSGCVTSIVMRPVSVVVARMQTETKGRGFLTVFQDVYRSEGPGAFYKGLGARVASSTPRMGILYSVYQTFISYSSDPDIITAIFPSSGYSIADAGGT
jgi:solute carrier family 25 phosphate transporter 23/24/25/41